MMKEKIKKLSIVLMVGLIALLGKGKVLAENCPERTTVNGPNSITFVGGVVDMGGDTEVKVWFEYGTSSGNYTFKTEKKTMTQTGKYCITVSNLQPCTTYYYRAAMENKAGPSYGAEMSKTTLCSTSSNQSQIKARVLGVATQAPTGLVKNILSHLVLPLLIAALLTTALKSRLIFWEKLMDQKKKEYQKFKSEKLLQLKVAKEKFQRKYNES